MPKPRVSLTRCEVLVSAAKAVIRVLLSSNWALTPVSVRLY